MFFIEKNASWACNHFFTLFWTSSLEWKHWRLRCCLIFEKRCNSDGAKSGRIYQLQEFKRCTVMAALTNTGLPCKRRTALVNPGLLHQNASLSLFRVSWQAASFIVELGGVKLTIRSLWKSKKSVAITFPCAIPDAPSVLWGVWWRILKQSCYRRWDLCLPLHLRPGSTLTLQSKIQDNAVSWESDG